MRGAAEAALTASPVLVGAVTVLVTIVAVFLSYNANSGLPFVPTYDLKANLPERGPAREGLRGAHRRRARGPDLEDRADAARDGTAYAQVTMKLDKSIEPLPADSTLLVRPRSALGLKYVELTPGRGAGEASRPGATIPVRQARPRGRRAGRLLQHVRREGPRRPAQLARRLRRRPRRPRPGPQHGDRRRSCRCSSDLEPVAEEPGSPGDAARPLLHGARRRRRSEVAPVAEEQADAVREPGHHVHRARRRSRGPFLQETISESPPTRGGRDPTTSRSSGRSSRNNAAFFRELRPGVATLPHSAPILADASQPGTRDAAEDAADQPRRWRTSSTPLADFSEDPMVRAGVAAADAAVVLAEADAAPS